MKDYKVKVLMFGSDLSIKGGMTTVVKSFLNASLDEIKIKYVPTHYSESTIVNMCKFFMNLYYINSEIKRNDIIHMHMSERGSCIRKYILYRLSKKNKKKVIIHMHGAEFKEYYEKASNFIKVKIEDMLVESDYVFTLGENWNNYVKSINNKINSVILRNSVDIPSYCVSIDQRIFKILFLAVIEKRKGIYELVEGIDKLVNCYSGNKIIEVTIAGVGQEEEKIRSLVKEKKLEKYFRFVGWVENEDKIKLLKEAHLFVLPSYNEGLPMAILEAMSYGIPVIATDVGSINEAVRDEINGYLIKTPNSELLKDRILRCIEDIEMWNKMSSRSKEIAISEFNNDVYFKKVKKIYIDCLKDRY